MFNFESLNFPTTAVDAVSRTRDAVTPIVDKITIDAIKTPIKMVVDFNLAFSEYIAKQFDSTMLVAAKTYATATKTK